MVKKGDSDMKKSIVKGIMLQHTDGDLEYYEPEFSDEDMDAIFKILDKYGDDNWSIRGELDVINLDD